MSRMQVFDTSNKSYLYVVVSYGNFICEIYLVLLSHTLCLPQQYHNVKLAFPILWPCWMNGTNISTITLLSGGA